MIIYAWEDTNIAMRCPNISGWMVPFFLELMESINLSSSLPHVHTELRNNTYNLIFNSNVGRE